MIMTDSLNISFDSSFEVLGLPLISAQTGDQKILFLLDSGCNCNMIRTDVIDVYGKNIKAIKGNCSVYGMDKMVHQTHLYEFTYAIQNQKLTDTFQNMPNAAALDFSLNKKTRVRVHGILGMPFLVRYKLVMDFARCILCSKPKPDEVEILE